MNVSARATVAVAAGVVGWTAFPPIGWWPMALLSVTGFVVAIHGERPRRGAWLGLVYGVAFFGPLLSWMHVLGADALAALVVLEALFFAGLGAAVAAVLRLPGWPAWVALLWVAAELARGSVPFGGFPWGRLAYAQATSPLGHLAPYGTAALVTAAVALTGSLLAGAMLTIRQAIRPLGRPAIPTVALAGSIAVLAITALLPIGGAISAGNASTPSVPVSIIQGNVPGDGMDALGEARTVTRNHLAATEQLAADVAAGKVDQPAFVIWPENSTDIDPLTDPETRAVVDQAVEAVGVPILVGAILDGPGPTYRKTAGVVWDPITGPGQTYVKRHPVPFGEYIPFRNQLLPLIGRLELVGRDTYAGDKPGDLSIASTEIGDVICFEIAYDGIVRDVVTGGAQLIVVQTNNATYGGTSQPEQQFEISRLRAIEYGRTVLVASTNGISGVIAPDGHVVQRTEQGTRAILSADVTPRFGRTMAARLGPWPERTMALGGLVPVGFVVVKGIRRRRVAAAGEREEAEVAVAP